MIRGVGGFSGKWWRLRKEKIQEKVCKILVLLNTAMPAILRIYVATVAHSPVHILYSKEIRSCIIRCTQLAVAELMFSCWWLGGGLPRENCWTEPDPASNLQRMHPSTQATVPPVPLPLVPVRWGRLTKPLYQFVHMIILGIQSILIFHHLLT